MKPKVAVVTIIFSLAGIASFYLFWRDLTGAVGKLNEEPVAEVTLKSRTVQRHFAGRLNWTALNAKSPLYSGDVIRTGDAAGVAVRFVSGDMLQLDEDSMVQVFYSEKEGVKLDVSGGGTVNVRSAGEKPVTLVSGGKTVTVARAEEKSVAVSENGLLEEKPEAAPVAALVEAAAEIAAQNAPPEPPPEPEKNPPTVTLHAPAGNLVEGESRPALSFTASGASSFTIIVAREGEGAAAVRAASAETSTVVLPPLPAGTYRWTVEASSGEEAAAESAAFSVREASPLEAPVLASPQPGARIGRAALEQNALAFSWRPSPRAEAYILTVSRAGSPPFLQTAPLRAASYTAQNIQAAGTGNFSWSVEAVTLDGRGEVLRRSPPSRGTFSIGLEALQTPRVLE
jgi:hypothetical protein